jgi:hypothetical protein
MITQYRIPAKIGDDNRLILESDASDAFTGEMTDAGLTGWFVTHDSVYPVHDSIVDTNFSVCLNPAG